MTDGLNRVMLIGHLGRSPEMRYTPSGKPVTSFSIVITHSWIASGGERHEETDWFNVVAWGDLAEASKSSLEKGHQVYVEGRLKTRRWKNRSADHCSCAEVVAQQILPLPLQTELRTAVRSA